MVRLLAAACCVLIVVLCAGSSKAFFDLRHHGFGAVLPQDNPHDLGQFWNTFHGRVQHMEQTAKQNADQLESLLRRWIPQQDAPDLLPSDDFEREHLEDHDEDPFNPFFHASDTEEDSSAPPGFGFGGVGSIFHALGIRPSVTAGAAFPRVWWQGPNVCVTREELEDKNNQSSSSGRQMSSVSATTTILMDDGDSSYRFSSCEQSPSKYICTTVVKENGVKKTHVVKHECCHGYRRDNSQYCSKMNLKDVVATAQQIGATIFAQSIEASGVDINALRQRNVTLFAPSDAAMQGFNSALLEQNEVEVYVHQFNRVNMNEVPAADSDNSLQKLVLSHITPGLIDLRDAVNEQVLYTENQEKSSIRVNVFPGVPPLVTVNCVPVQAEALAENGSVVLVSRVLSPVVSSLASLVEDNPQLSTFKTILEKAGLWDQLDSPGHWTVFAPTDEAFKKLPSGMLSRLLEGSGCIDNVARHHVAAHTLCTSCVHSPLTSTSLAGELLRLTNVPSAVEGSDDGELRVENATVTERDVMATNGVLHLVDQVLMPDSARSLSQALADRGFESLVRTLGERGLLDELDAMRNVTFFVPSEAALAREAESPSRETLLYHVATPQVASCDLENNMMLNSQLPDAALRINLFQTMPTFNVGPVRATVQCARVVGVDELACGAMVHELDRVLTRPSGDVLTTLEQYPEHFSILRDVIKGTKYEERLKTADKPMTLLAPTNQAFDRISAEMLEKLRNDSVLREHVLSKHILTEVLCCDGVATPNWPFTNHVSTEYGTPLQLRRSPSGKLQVGPLELSKCDIAATNGVVHAVDMVRLASQGRKSGMSLVGQSPHNPNVEVQIFGL